MTTSTFTASLPIIEEMAGPRLVAWLDWGRRTRRWKDTTIDAYARRVRRWLAWCEANDIRPDRATPANVEAWLAQLHPSPSVRSNAQSALVAWYDWRKASGKGSRNPARAIVRVPVRRVVPRSLTADEARDVLNTAARQGPKWSCYIGTMLYAGLRRAEACQIRWVDLEGGGRWLRVIGKGELERVVPVHERLRGYLSVWRGRGEHPIWVFPGQWGKHMSLSAANSGMRQILDGAGLPDASGHWLRHTFATRLLQQGADIAAVQAALGHESLQSTTVYVRARPEQVRAAVRKLDY